MDWDKYDSIRFEEGEYAYSRAVDARREERRRGPETESQARVRRALQQREEDEVRTSVNCGPWGDGE